jgi:hypothetical protein
LLQDQQQVPEQVLLQLEQALRMVFQYHQSEQVLLQLEQVQCQEQLPV